MKVDIFYISSVLALLSVSDRVRGMPTQEGAQTIDDLTRTLQLQKVLDELENDGALVIRPKDPMEQESILLNYDPNQLYPNRNIIPLNGKLDEMPNRLLATQMPTADDEEETEIQKEIKAAVEHFFTSPQLEPRYLHDFLFVDRYLDAKETQGLKFHSVNNGGRTSNIYMTTYLPNNVVVEDEKFDYNGDPIVLQSTPGKTNLKYYMERMGTSLSLDNDFLSHSFFFKDFYFANTIMESVLDLSLLLPSGFIYPSNPILIPARDLRSALFRAVHPDHEKPEEYEGPVATLDGQPYYPIGFAYKPMIFDYLKENMCPFAYVGSSTHAGRRQPTLKTFLNAGKKFSNFLGSIRFETFRILQTKHFAKKYLNFEHGMMTTDYVFATLYGCRLSLISLDEIAPYRYSYLKSGEEKSISLIQPQDVRVNNDEDAMTFVLSVFEFFQILIGTEPALKEHASTWSMEECEKVWSQLEKMGDFFYQATGRSIKVDLGDVVFRYRPHEAFDGSEGTNSDTTLRSSIYNRVSRVMGWEAKGSQTERAKVELWPMNANAETILKHSYFDGLSSSDVAQ